jgi:hypothetical protein
VLWASSDAVNPALAATGPAPTCGAGNSDLLLPGIRLAAARALGVRPPEVDVEFVGHHYHVRLLLRDEPTDDHTSAPSGLAGGYDVRFAGRTVSVRLPAGLGADAARRMVERAQIGDGIAAIGADGSVTFTERAAGTMRELLGYDCPVLRPDEAEARVEELRARLARVVARG